jgi:hypothetical protein
VSLTYVLSEADRVFRQGRREFVRALAERLDALGATAAAVERGTQVVWSCADHCGSATLCPLDRPAADDPGRPLIPQVRIGAPPVGLPLAIRQQIGWAPGLPEAAGGHQLLPAARFALLLDEVAVLAPWLAEWAVCRALPGRLLPPSPIPFRGSGQGFPHCGKLRRRGPRERTRPTGSGTDRRGCARRWRGSVLSGWPSRRGSS